jgi:HEAT repeat protein
VKLTAAHAVARMKPRPVEELAAVLAQGGPEARLGAVQALGCISDWDKVRAPVLIRAFADPDPRVRYAAVHALHTLTRKYWAEARSTVEALAEEDESEEVRTAARLALGPGTGR